MVRTAIYVRVSTAEQAKEGYSIGEQTDRLKMFAGAHGWQVVKVYTDAGHSGATTDRPALQDMLSDIRAGLIDKVLVYKLDRLSRSQKDTLKLIEDEFLPHGTDFESMSESLDTSTPQGRLFLGILAAFAQLEREVIKERMSMGIEARVREGKWRGGHGPFGYRRDPDTGNLVIDEYEAMIVKRIYRDFLDGKTIFGIHCDLEREGLVFRSGKAPTVTIRCALRRKTYCGYQKIGNDWIQCDHEPIITEDQWERVQKILDDNQRTWKDKGNRPGSEAYTTNLAGLIYCARCGARYNKAVYASHGYRYDKYSCVSRTKRRKSSVKDPNCKNKNWNISELDDLVIGEVKKLALDQDYLRRSQNNQSTVDESSEEALIKDQLKSIKTQISRLTDLYSTGLFDLDDLEAKIRPLNDQHTRLQQTLDGLQTHTTAKPMLTEEQTKDLLSTFGEAMDHGSLADRRTILNQLIDRIDLDGDDITIKWNF